MRGVSRGVARGVAAGLLLAMLATPSAFASDEDEPGRFFDRFQRAKRFIVVVLSRFGGPPG